jgi:hypothetical protein
MNQTTQQPPEWMIAAAKDIKSQWNRIYAAGSQTNLIASIIASHAQESVNRRLIDALEKAARELNEIRARDGVPYTHYGMRACVDENYFSGVVDECFSALQSAEQSDHVADVRKMVGMESKLAELVTVCRPILSALETDQIAQHSARMDKQRAKMCASLKSAIAKYDSTKLPLNGGEE